MNVFEKIKSMNIDEFTEWFSENHMYNDLAVDWWNDTYCSKCEPEDDPSESSWHKFARCELNGNSKCKYFQDLDDIPDYKQIVRLWLESEWQNEEIKS